MAGAGWWVVRGSVAQLWDQLRWVGVGEGGENIPALLTGGLDDGAQGGEALCALGGAGAAGDFLTQLDHPEISLGLVVCEGDLSRLVEEVQALCLSFLEAERAVVAGPSLGPSVFYGREWWEALVEGDGILEDAVLGVGDLALERGGWWAVVFEGVGGGLPSAQEEGAHPLCPLFPVESCEGVEFAK